jgi:sarcosine oxidase
MESTYDVIVLGIGAMGSAAAFELARRGRRVLGLEQYSFAHDKGSSHGQTRIIRTAYFEHPDYVPLAKRAYERWYELEQLRGTHLFTECGCLNIGKPDGELVAGVRKAAELHRLPIEVLTAAERRRRFPVFQFADDYIAVLEREAGFLYVEDCVRAHVEAARSAGADLHDNEPVISWEATSSGVTVQTEKHRYHARKLVISAGAWANRTLAELGLPLEVRRQVLLWFGTPDASKLRRDIFPVYMADTPAGFYYGFPAIDPNGHKLARHDIGQTVHDPAKVDRNVTTDDEADCRQFLAEHLPVVNGPRRAGKVCLYTLTPDRHFIIDVHPHHAHVAIAAGFSGHGFKFASAVGEILADLAEKGRTELPIGLFGIGRFSR